VSRSNFECAEAVAVCTCLAIAKALRLTEPQSGAFWPRFAFAHSPSLKQNSVARKLAGRSVVEAAHVAR
jgi:hypothetical protein